MVQGRGGIEVWRGRGAEESAGRVEESAGGGNKWGEEKRRGKESRRRRGRYEVVR